MEGKGIGAGGLFTVIHRKGNLINVLQAILHRCQGQGVAALSLGQKLGGIGLCAVVGPHPLYHKGGVLPLGQAGQLPANLHGSVQIGVVEGVRADELRGDRLSLQQDTLAVGQDFAFSLRVGSGDHHSIVHAAVLIQLGQHARRDLEAGGSLVGGIGGYQRLLVQRKAFIGKVATIELDSELGTAFVIAQIVAPVQSEGGIPGGRHGVKGESQEGCIPSNHMELQLVADHVVAGVACAVIGHKGTLDPAG